MRNTGLDEAQAGIKISGKNSNNLRYTDDTTLMAKSEEELRPDRWRALGPRREKARHARGECAKPLAARAALAAEGKGAVRPWSGRTNLWLPGPLAAEIKGAQHLGRGRQNYWLPGRNTASASHTQRHLPAAPRPPRSRTELN